MAKETFTWRQGITSAMEEAGDRWDNVIQKNISDEELDRVFDPGYGVEEGSPFTLWTLSRVYFPCCYDGSEWVASVPRNPSDEIIGHIGG